MSPSFLWEGRANNEANTDIAEEVITVRCLMSPTTYLPTSGSKYTWEWVFLELTHFCIWDLSHCWNVQINWLLSKTEEYSTDGHLLASFFSPIFKALAILALFPTPTQSESGGLY